MKAEVHVNRRRILRAKLESSAILIPSARQQPRNYAANSYPFHQDATFRYYTGLVIADAALYIDASGTETLYLSIPDPDDVIWTGPVESPEALAARAGIANVKDISDLKLSQERVHYIAAYDAGIERRLAAYLDCPLEAVNAGESIALKHAIIEQRNHKDDAEVAEIEEAIMLTHRMLANAFGAISVGRLESDIMAALKMPALAKSRAMSFEPIVTVNGQTLHNESYDNRLEAGQLLLIDCGCESPEGYCSDLSRTYPVSGRMTSKQAEIYRAVSKAKERATDETKRKGASQLDVHLTACIELTSRLIDAGLMCGDPLDAVACGAHALFMPHGIGHMLGLDVHDMENFGDDVGYLPGQSRNPQFGLHALRLARPLEPGFVVTIEPGCYFIPALIDRWQAQGLHKDFIRYDKVQQYRDFGGIRLEDDVLITQTGSRVLGA